MSSRDLVRSLEQAVTRGQKEEAGRVLKELLAFPRVDADTLLQAGSLLAGQEFYEEAARAYARCATDYPKLFEGHYNLALAEFALEKYPESLAALEKAPEGSASQDVARQYLRGKIEATLGRAEAARVDLEAAFTKAPGDENYALDLGLFHLRHGLYSKAAEVFEKGTRANPSSSYLWLGLSVALLQDGQYTRCIEACRHLLDLQRDFSPAWLMLAFVLELEGKLEEAEKAAAQGLAAHNPYPYLYYYHVSLLLKLHSTDYGRMRRELAHAQQGIPNCTLCAVAESKVRQGEGDIPGAIAKLQWAVNVDPGLAEAWYRLAVLYDRAGLPQDAARAREVHDRLKAQKVDREAEMLRREFMKSLGNPESQPSR